MTFKFWMSTSNNKRTWRIFGNPISVVLAVLAVLGITGFACSAAKYVRDSYFPYQGKVVAIKKSWADWVLFESGDQEHLIIQTPDGKTINRVISMQTRILQRIDVGDYVVKNRGFRNQIKPCNTRTIQEMHDGDTAIDK
jgi:hypothetical protein